MHVFDTQTRWIADHIIVENIVLTIHLGDTVDRSLDVLWIDALSSLNYIDGLAPIVISAGNHDVIDNSAIQKSSYRLFNKYYPEDKFKKLSNFGGTFEKGKIENAYYFFDFGGVEYLILTLEFGPRDKVLNWANRIVEKFTKKEVVIVTHAYMAKGSQRLKAESKVAVKAREVPYDLKDYEYTNTVGSPNDGDIIWERLVKKHKNILFVLSGHSKGPGKLISKGIKGNTVFQVGSNYQGWKNGGNGYLRLMKFYPKEKKVEVKTYSPLLNQYRTDEENQFQIDLNKGEFLELNLPPAP